MYLCMGCMEEFDDSLDTCSHCGYKRGTPPKEAYHLPPETILNKRFIVGRVLDFNEYSITYIGWDGAQKRAVSIQEFFPPSLAHRVPGQKEAAVEEKSQRVFLEHRRRFLEKDTLWLALQGMPGAFQTLYIFFENATAYIVREYFPHSSSLKAEILKAGCMPHFEKATEILAPVMEALCVLHRAGLVHRDINPACILLTEHGIKICPTGCVTHMGKGRGIVLSPGFSAPEMYRAQTKVTASADVYSICAVFYYMLTRQIPPESVDRLQHDTLRPFALQRGMALRRKKRIQTIDELIDLFPGIVINAYNQQKAMIKIRSDCNDPMHGLHGRI